MKRVGRAVFWLVVVPVFWMGLATFLNTLPSLAALYTRPLKTCGTRTYGDEVALGCKTILATELDQDFNNLVATVNNLDTNNLSPTAGILGSQLANGTITSTQIQDGTIVSADISGTAGILGTQLAANTIDATRLAVNATLRNFQVTTPTLGADISTVQTTLLTFPAITTTTGGRLVFLDSVVGFVGLLAFEVDVVTIRFKRDGATLQTWDYQVSQSEASGQVPISLPSHVENLGAGASHVYTLTVQTNSANAHFHTPALNVGSAFLMELS